MKTMRPLLYSFDEEKDKVDSSNIKMAKYSEITRTFLIQFNGGNVYMYSSLPPSVYKSFCIAESKGRFFYRKIKGAYPCIKLNLNSTPES